MIRFLLNLLLILLLLPLILPAPNLSGDHKIDGNNPKNSPEAGHLEARVDLVPDPSIAKVQQDGSTRQNHKSLHANNLQQQHLENIFLPRKQNFKMRLQTRHKVKQGEEGQFED